MAACRGGLCGLQAGEGRQWRSEEHHGHLLAAHHRGRRHRRHDLLRLLLPLLFRRHAVLPLAHGARSGGEPPRRGARPPRLPPPGPRRLYVHALWRARPRPSPRGRGHLLPPPAVRSLTPGPDDRDAHDHRGARELGRGGVRAAGRSPKGGAGRPEGLAVGPSPDLQRPADLLCLRPRAPGRDPRAVRVPGAPAVPALGRPPRSPAAQEVRLQAHPHDEP
mmetsp:Transcript_9127/g.25524  ORF Transcript_9127/g.25524 Transcript_9127/m.25524 type:complete len:220 (-) Transcript_9127:916-1575(-)